MSLDGFVRGGRLVKSGLLGGVTLPRPFGKQQQKEPTAQGHPFHELHTVVTLL